MPDKENVLPLLLHEVAEFEAVLGQPVTFDSSSNEDSWDVVVDPDVASASLVSDLVARRLTLRIPSPTEFMNGLNLLHSLAHSAETQVADTEAPTYAIAFDRIHNEIANIYPSMQLRNLDWATITESYLYVRDLQGPEFWEGTHRWIAELGDAHTQLVEERHRFHPPYLAAIAENRATLVRVPEDSDAWRAGVRDGDRLLVESPEHWLQATGASPQQHALIAGRRFLAMTTDTRDFTAITKGKPVTWTETRRSRPSIRAIGNQISISSITSDLPGSLRAALARADPTEPLTLDLRGNVGGNLVAAIEARQLLIRSDESFGSIAFTDGRGHLTAPVPLTITPDADAWAGEIHVLIDAMTYSASEDFLHPLVGLPHVTIIGGPTGGGSGRPHTRLIKDGIRLSISTAITYTRDGSPIEYLGIQPTA